MSKTAKRGAVLSVLALLLSLLVVTPARAEMFQPRQQWLRDATNGLFLHWGMRTAPSYTDCAAWEQAVTGGGWTAQYWVAEAKKLHAQYVVLASFHSRLGYARAWPSKIPGTCSTQRDYLGELIAAAKAEGIRTILYMTDDPQWYWEGLRERPTDPNDPDDITKPSWMNSAAYSDYKDRPVNLQRRPGFGEFSYDNFIEVMQNYPDLAGFWIDNDNAFWEQNGLYERIRVMRPQMTLSNNNEDTPIMDMVSHEQKVGMTPAYDYPQAVLTPQPRLTEGEWKLPVRGAWWFDGTDADVDYPVTLGRIISNAGSSVKSLMAETAMVNGKFPSKQEEFNNFAKGYLDQIWPAINGVEGGGYMYGGLKPGFWNDGAHGVTTVSKTDPDLHYVHVMTKPATADSITLGDNGYRVTRVSDLRTGRVKAFTQADGQLTIHGVAAWDTYDTVFRVETAGRVGFYPTGTVRATASAAALNFPARHLTDGDYLTRWDSNTTLPVSVTLDMGRARPVRYLAVNQTEWSPTYNRSSFNRPEDSARIKEYNLYASPDGVTWGTAIASGTMPSHRAVQFVDLQQDLVGHRYLKLEVLSTWAAANAPNYFRKLRIDEMWVGFAHAGPSVSGPTTYEAETGVTRGLTRVVACATCSGGAKVTNIGNDAGNEVTVTVNAVRPGNYVLTLVGPVTGTRTVHVRVNDGAAQTAVATGGSDVLPMIARSLRVRLNPGLNDITFFNDDGFAPDLDRITISRL